MLISDLGESAAGAHVEGAFWGPGARGSTVGQATSPLQHSAWFTPYIGHSLFTQAAWPWTYAIARAQKPQVRASRVILGGWTSTGPTGKTSPVIPWPHAARFGIVRPMRRLVLSCLLLGCGAATTTVTTDELPPEERATNEADAPAEAGPRSIGYGSFGSALASTDPIDEAGRAYHTYALELAAGTRVRIAVPAGELDPMLRLEGPDGWMRAVDDTFPPSLDAILELAPPASGTYTLTVTTAPSGQFGRYTLEVGPATIGGAELTLGGRSEHELGRGDTADRAHPGVSLLRFHADGGSVVRVRVTSPAFDTIATVMGPTGEMWVNDDANDLGEDGSERALDSTVELSIPTTGDYQLIVSAYGGAGGGPFAVRTTVRPPVVMHGSETVPTGPFAGPDGRGRILGLYAGITEYVSAGRLYGCADDARLLGEAMRAAHLQRVDEQEVLLDGAVTRAAFLDGLRRLARTARPDDVVLVFYSGHGNVQPVAAGAPGPTAGGELDGLDETIVLIDGPLTDDEVVREMDGIRAGTVLLALDSCHAGGFAEDFVVRPGRVGIFSSDEDVLSDTAEPRRAGGYLSWYLRRGVLGEADYKPRDGVLHAGELTDYLVDGFVTDHRLMNPEGDLDPSQRLDVRRGSVTWPSVLWVYPRGEDLAMPTLPAVSLESAPAR